MFLLCGNGVHRQLLLGLFASREAAEAALDRLTMSNDGYHVLAVVALEVGVWGPEVPDIDLGRHPTWFNPDDHRVRLPLPEVGARADRESRQPINDVRLQEFATTFLGWEGNMTGLAESLGYSERHAWRLKRAAIERGLLPKPSPGPAGIAYRARVQERRERRQRALAEAGPILIRCEGSGYRLATGGRTGLSICSMCGTPMVTDDGLAPEHQRDDIIARIKRGDFGD